jgi:hypothetical protein
MGRTGKRGVLVGAEFLAFLFIAFMERPSRNLFPTDDSALLSIS